jgi:environmental stress-induced protein Ves
VSIASVASDGPFSRFAGYDRIILALDGNGIVLRHAEPGTQVTLEPLQPHAFCGDWQTDCALRGGALRDFGVMVRRGVTRAELTLVRPPAGTSPLVLRAPLTLLYGVAGEVCIVTPQQRITCVAGNTLEIEAVCPGQALVQAAADTLLIQVSLQPAAG